MAKNRYHGVSPGGGSFKVQIFRKGKVFYLGSWGVESEAARYADRAFLLTSAWTNRPDRVNFQDSQLPHPDKLTEKEQDMVDFLREHYPTQEVMAKEEKAIDGRLPQVLQRCQEYEEQYRSFFEGHSDFLSQCNDALRLAAKTECIQEERLENYKARILELENQLAAMGCPVPKYEFKPIFPPPVGYQPDSKPVVATKRDMRTPFEIGEEKRLAAVEAAGIKPPPAPTPQEQRDASMSRIAAAAAAANEQDRLDRLERQRLESVAADARYAAEQAERKRLAAPAAAAIPDTAPDISPDTPSDFDPTAGLDAGPQGTDGFDREV